MIKAFLCGGTDVDSDGRLLSYRSNDSSICQEMMKHKNPSIHSYFDWPPVTHHTCFVSNVTQPEKTEALHLNVVFKGV